MFRRILIAWDGSPPAEWAFDAALDVARRFNAELCAISVAHSPAHAETEEDRRESVADARRYLEESYAPVKDRAERAGVAVDQIVIEGEEPAAAILDYTHEHGFDLLVIGHHRKSRSRRFLIHGLTSKTMDTADLPVLVVPHGYWKT
ncbi:MAG TPA: universal stress protein [Gaiellaceae bacterium]|nr:universal stress protein [Gaiellaceae bacterium]